MVTPLGVDANRVFDRLTAGETGIRPAASFDTEGLPSRMCAEISEFEAKEFIPGREIRKMDRLSRIAVAAAKMAMDDAGLIIDDGNRDRVGISLGVAYGSVDVSVQFATALFTEGPTMVNPILVPNTVMNAPAGHASIALGFRGVNVTVNHKEASGETAIAFAAGQIQKGRADVMFAGGADTMGRLIYEILTRFRALSPLDGNDEAARPMDVARNGAVAGEGAGVICLEEKESAKKRGARIYGEIAGWGMSAAPAPLNDWPTETGGPVSALTRALESAKIAPGDVSYISASASGHPSLDDLEARAICEVFGEGQDGPAVSSAKGALGESCSSGGMRAALAGLTLARGTAPPTAGLSTPAVPLNHVAGGARGMDIRYIVQNGFSSGGTFVSLVFKNIN
jgi:3-oxoacyl-[acyl-carrier-protein] synthase II